MIGVYLLKQGEKIVYVGSSTKVETRITQHQNDISKTFDSYQVIGCAESELCNLEAYYIEKYKPVFNKNKRNALLPDYSSVWISTANKYDKIRILEFVRECLYYYKLTDESLSIKYNILLEDSKDLFLCRTLPIEVLTTYFNCNFKNLLPDDIAFVCSQNSKNEYFGIHLSNYNK